MRCDPTILDPVTLGVKGFFPNQEVEGEGKVLDGGEFTSVVCCRITLT